MAIASRGYQAATGNTNSAVVTMPNNAQIGDYAVVSLSTAGGNAYNPNSFTPTNWLPIYSDKTNNSSSQNLLAQRVWQKVLTSADISSGSITVSLNAIVVWSLSVAVLSGTGGATALSNYSRFNSEYGASTVPVQSIYAGGIQPFINTTLATTATVASSGTQTISTNDYIPVKVNYNNNTHAVIGQGTGRDEEMNITAVSGSSSPYSSTLAGPLLRSHPTGEVVQTQSIVTVNGPADSNGNLIANSTVFNIDLPVQVGWQFRLSRQPDDVRNLINVVAVSGSGSNSSITFTPAMYQSNTDLVAGDSYLVPSGDNSVPNFPGAAVLIIGSGYLDSSDSGASVAAPPGTGLLGSTLSSDANVLTLAALDTNVAQYQPIDFYSAPVTFEVQGNMIDRCLTLALLIRPASGHGIPIADTGLDLFAYTGDPVFLDGSRSWNDSGEVPTITWSQTTGPTTVNLTTIPGADPRHRMFTAPGIAGVYTFTLRATDPSLATSDPNNAYTEDIITVTINSNPTPVNGDLLRQNGLWVTTQRTYK